MFRYKRELKSLIRHLGLEVVIFQNTCEVLLTGLVPPNERDIMLDNPGGPLWADPYLDKQLQERLRGAYGVYMATVEDMIAAVEEFRTRLKLGSLSGVSAISRSIFSGSFI